MHDELARIQWLKTRFELDGSAEGQLIGIGDDAAVISWKTRPTVITVDAQVEGVHFRRDFLSSHELGERAMVVAVSDVWAMGALPTASAIALTLPAELPERDFRELIEGLASGAATTGARVVGGNLSGGPVISVTTTVFGAPVGEPLARSGARAGDAIYVTGRLGVAALGLAVLEAGRGELTDVKELVERWRRPPRHDAIVAELSGIATAAIDLSDGCLQDLGHLCAASGVGAVLHAERIPTARGHEAACGALGLNPLATALAGGEDYEILFTAPACTDADAIGSRIGETTEAREVRVLDADGTPIELASAGYRHFS